MFDEAHKYANSELIDHEPYADKGKAKAKEQDDHPRKKQRTGEAVNIVEGDEEPRYNRNSVDYEKSMTSTCVFHENGNHTTAECNFMK